MPKAPLLATQMEYEIYCLFYDPFIAACRVSRWRTYALRSVDRRLFYWMKRNRAFASVSKLRAINQNPSFVYVRAPLLHTPTLLANIISRTFPRASYMCERTRQYPWHPASSRKFSEFRDNSLATTSFHWFVQICGKKQIQGRRMCPIDNQVNAKLTSWLPTCASYNREVHVKRMWHAINKHECRT